MTPEQRLRAAQALWRERDAAGEQMQAALLIAKQRKFRPKTVVSLDNDRKARHLAGVSELSEELAARVLLLYHFAEQRPMMATFLDALSIAHDDGLIREDAPAPDPAKTAAAAAAIARAYPAHDVALYLNTLVWQDPKAWATLQDVPEARLP